MLPIHSVLRWTWKRKWRIPQGRHINSLHPRIHIATANKQGLRDKKREKLRNIWKSAPLLDKTTNILFLLGRAVVGVMSQFYGFLLIEILNFENRKTQWFYFSIRIWTHLTFLLFTLKAKVTSFFWKLEWNLKNFHSNFTSNHRYLAENDINNTPVP